jgi:hypothetical protein
MTYLLKKFKKIIIKQIQLFIVNIFVINSYLFLINIANSNKTYN